MAAPAAEPVKPDEETLQGEPGKINFLLRADGAVGVTVEILGNRVTAREPGTLRLGLGRLQVAGDPDLAVAMLDQAEAVKRVLRTNIHKQSKPVREPERRGQVLGRVGCRDIRGGQWNLARRVTFSCSGLAAKVKMLDTSVTGQWELVSNLQMYVLELTFPATDQPTHQGSGAAGAGAGLGGRAGDVASLPAAAAEGKRNRFYLLFRVNIFYMP